MWMSLRAKNVFAAALFQLGILVVVNGPQTTTTTAAPEPRGPRFGVKPHPGRVEHIHPGTHGEIVSHHDPRVLQGINRDEFKLASNAVDASGYWGAGRFGAAAGSLAAERGGSIAAASSGYYEGISKPKYQYRKSVGYMNVNGARGGTSANLWAVCGFALVTLVFVRQRT